MRVDRRVVLVLCALWMILCTTGCASSNPDSNQNAELVESVTGTGNGQNQIMPTQEDTKDSEESRSDVTVQVGADDSFSESQQNSSLNQTEMISLNTEHIYEQYADRQTQASLVNINYHSISLKEGNEALKDLVARWMRKRQQDLEKLGLDLMVETKKLQEKYQDESLVSGIWHEIKVYRADGTVISFMDREYVYSAEYWNNNYRCVNFDVRSGQSLMLSNVVVDKNGFYQAAVSYYVEESKEQDLENFSEQDFVNKIVSSIEKNENWCLDASGFLFVYEDDDLEYTSSGVLYLHVPYEVVKDYINTDYLWGNACGIAALSVDQCATVTAEEETHRVSVVKKYDEYYIQETIVNYDENSIPVGNYVRVEDIYLVNQGEEQYLLLDMDYASDDYAICLYRLHGDNIVESDWIEGDLDSSNVSARTFGVSKRIDVLGTYSCYLDYWISPEHKLSTYETEYEIEHFGYAYNVLTTTKEIPVEKQGKTVTLPINTKLCVLSTDNATWAKVLLVDTEEEAILRFVKEDYLIIIDGINEYECFEMLPYAG